MGKSGQTYEDMILVFRENQSGFMPAILINSGIYNGVFLEHQSGLIVGFLYICITCNVVLLLTIFLNSEILLWLVPMLEK